MRKIIVVFLALIMIGSVAVAEDGGADSKAYINIGDYNEAVVALHRKLSDLGYYELRPESPWSYASADALKILQENLDIPVTGIVADKEMYDEILGIESVVGKNLVINGDFSDGTQYWSPWGTPTVCEIVTMDNKDWIHLISSGTRFEGLMQDAAERNHDAGVAELKAGRQYTVSFTVYGTQSSVGKHFNIGFHNKSLADGSIQEQYWTPSYELKDEPVRYTYTFKCNVDGTFRIMVGTGQEDVIEAWYSDIKIEAGRKAT